MDSILVGIIIILMLVGLVLELLPAYILTFLALASLIITGIVTPEEAFAGFASKELMTVAMLFIVAAAFQNEDVAYRLGKFILCYNGRPRKSLLRLMSMNVVVTAFFNNTPIVAILTPIVRKWAIQNQFAPSKFLIPVSYVTQLGGVITLFGTSTNLIISGLMNKSGLRGFSFFELAYIGVPCSIFGILYILFFGYKFLPERKDLLTQAEEHRSEFLVEAIIKETSNLIQKTIEEASLRNLEGLFLVEIIRDGKVIAPVKSNDILLANDRLVFAGDLTTINQIYKINSVVPSINSIEEIDKNIHMVEAVVSHRSTLNGKTVKESSFRSKFDGAVIAVRRNGVNLQGKVGNIKLQPGDTLLLIAGTDFLKNSHKSSEFYLIANGTNSRVTEENPKKNLIYIPLAILTVMIITITTGVLPVFNAAFLAAVFLLIFRYVSTNDILKVMDWNVLIVIGNSLGLAHALEKSGLATYISKQIINITLDMGPQATLIAILICTTIVTQFITNNASGVLIFPIALSAAQQLNVDPRGFLVAVVLTASASFATPIGYQTNLMIYGPGGYRFTDFIKVGTPLNILIIIMGGVIIPMVWKF